VAPFHDHQERKQRKLIEAGVHGQRVGELVDQIAAVEAAL
jgi:hypothetical protein